MTQTLEIAIKDTRKLIAQLLNTHYPFALWRAPLSNHQTLMIDISREYISGHDESVWSLEDQSECFIVNPYKASHPVTPKVIKGDIVISIEGNNSEVSINPRLSSSDIETFVNSLEKNTSDNLRTEDVEHNQSGDFENSVAKAVESIKENTLQKVVLSRFKDVDIPKSFNSFDFFNKISGKYLNAFCYLISSKEHGVWMGATPERLVSIENQKHFTTDALAGTQKLTEESNLDDIAWTQKEIEEQAMVSRYIIDCFKKIRLREFDEIGPKTVKAGNLAHLKTSFMVDMESTNSSNLGSTMLDLLHPTSAICGFPREQAHKFIEENEGFDRELFSGFLGPVNFKRKTSLFVNLRCMKLNKQKIRLYAGAGITEKSNPAKEYEETNDKMNTLLSPLLSQ